MRSSYLALTAVCAMCFGFMIATADAVDPPIKPAPLLVEQTNNVYLDVTVATEIADNVKALHAGGKDWERYQKTIEQKYGVAALSALMTAHTFCSEEGETHKQFRERSMASIVAIKLNMKNGLAGGRSPIPPVKP